MAIYIVVSHFTQCAIFFMHIGYKVHISILSHLERGFSAHSIIHAAGLKSFYMYVNQTARVLLFFLSPLAAAVL